MYNLYSICYIFILDSATEKIIVINILCSGKKLNLNRYKFELFGIILDASI